MIRISKNVDHQIRYIGEKSYPDQGGGMLLGVTFEGILHIKETIEIPNSAELYRDQRYHLTQGQFQEAETIAKFKRLELMGFFQSHPNFSSSPSQYDLEHAKPKLVYLVVAVIGGKSSDITGWMIAEDRKRYVQKVLQIA